MSRLILAVTACAVVAGCAGYKSTQPSSPVPAVVVPEPEAVSCPEPAPCVCPEPETITVAVPVAKPCETDDRGLFVLGGVEWVRIDKQADRSRARIDTGAKTSSMHAVEQVGFERDGEPWVRFLFDADAEGSGEALVMEKKVERYVRIKRHDQEPQRRYVVKMLLTVGDLKESVEVTLSDRSDFEHPVLIGRNFLTDNAVVDVSQQYLAK